MFTDLVGFTTFSERSGEEAAYALMQRIAALMTDAVQEHGGTVKGFTGDGVMALFGVPVALEDAPLRACRAALLIQERLAQAAAEIEAEHGLRARMRIGINTGQVVVGRVQSGDSTNVTALGDAVNLAARLQTLAEPGSVTLSEGTYNAIQGLANTTFIGERHIKGKAEPQKIYRLDGLRRGAVRFDAALSRGLTAYVGRTHELETLERSLREATKKVQVINIVGEPGIGKSRLLHEFCERLPDKHVFLLSGSCSPDGQQIPLLPFIAIVRTSFRLTPGEPEVEVARKLERGLEVLGLTSAQNIGLLLNLLGLKVLDDSLKNMDGVLVGLRTRELLERLLQERCRMTAVVMIIEDLHWIDSVSEDLLAHFIGTQESLSLLVVHTRRPEYQPPWLNHGNVQTVRLEPLSVAQTSRIVQARLDADELPEGLTRLISEKAEGNPLFAEEITSFLLERGTVRRSLDGLEFDAQAAEAALPASLQALLTGRVDRLAVSDKALLQAAAAIGRQFSPDLLAAVVGSDDEIDERLSAMQALDLIRPEHGTGNFIFKHALVRDALYNSLLTGPRTAFHLRVAEEIERRSGNRLAEVAETLAHHYRATDRAGKAFQFLVMAGEKSLGIYSLDEAERYFRDALAVLDSTPDAATDKAAVDLLMHLLQTLALEFKYRDLKQIAERRLGKIEETGEPQQLVLGLYYYGSALIGVREFRKADEVQRRALALAEQLGDPKSRAYALGISIFCATVLANQPFEVVETWGKQAVAHSEAAGDSFIRNWILFLIAWDYMHRGLVLDARAWALRLVASGQERGDRRASGMGLWVLAWINIIDERYDDALLNAEECIQIAVAPFDRNNGLPAKGIALCFLGRPENGSALLHRAREEALTHGWLYQTAGLDPPLSISLVLTGEIQKGVKWLEHVIRERKSEGYVGAASWATLYLAEVYLEILSSNTRVSVSVVLRNLKLLVAVKISGSRKVLRLLDEVEKGNSQFSSRGCFPARINMDRGLLYKLKNRPDDARKFLEKARALAAPLGATAMLGKIDAALASMH